MVVLLNKLDMKEQLIEFETAKLANQKGFPMWYSSPNRVYDNGKVKINAFMNYAPSDYPNRFYPAPTQSLLQKWLREEHDIHIDIRSNLNNKKGNEKYEPEVFVYSYTRNPDIYGIKSFFTAPNKIYEQALEIALLEALKLI